MPSSAVILLRDLEPAGQLEHGNSLAWYDARSESTYQVPSMCEMICFWVVIMLSPWLTLLRKRWPIYIMLLYFFMEENHLIDQIRHELLPLLHKLMHKTWLASAEFLYKYAGRGGSAGTLMVTSKQRSHTVGQLINSNDEPAR